MGCQITIRLLTGWSELSTVEQVRPINAPDTSLVRRVSHSQQQSTDF
jgi:hypothetical protein